MNASPEPGYHIAVHHQQQLPSTDKPIAKNQEKNLDSYKVYSWRIISQCQVPVAFESF